MVEIFNSQNYLYLKQLLCLISLAKMKRVVSIEGTKVTEEKLKEEALSKLEDIKASFTIPVNGFRSNKTVIDLEEILDVAEAMFDEDDENLLKFIKSQLTQFHIFGLPHKDKYYKIYKDRYLEKKEYFEVREVASKLLDIADEIFANIENYINSNNNKYNINFTIAFMNVLEGIDFSLSLVEDGLDIFTEQEQSQEELEEVL